MRVGVIGCGTVGAAFLEWLHAHGHSVVGYDLSSDVTARLRARFGAAAMADRLADLCACESVHICVPTEPSQDGSADLSIITNVVSELAEVTAGLSTRLIVSQRSTCPPGTADRLASMGHGWSYGVNPSFLRKGSIKEDTANPDRVALGGDATYLEHMLELYAGLPAPRMVTAVRSTIELVKYAENAVDATLIALWNEILEYAVGVGLDADEFVAMLDAFGARGKFATTARVPGRAFGLGCLPKDVRALAHDMRAMGCEPVMLEGVMARNELSEQALGVGARSSVELFEVAQERVLLMQRGIEQVRTGVDALRSRSPATDPA